MLFTCTRHWNGIMNREHVMDRTQLSPSPPSRRGFVEGSPSPRSERVRWGNKPVQTFSTLCSDKTLQQWNCRLQFYPVSQRPESELNTFPKKALKVAGTCGNGKINWASVPSWPQDWTMVCTMVGWCVIIRRPRQAFPKAPLMSLNCKSAQLNIPGKWNTTFTVLLPLHTFLLLICNDLQLQYSVKKSFPYSLDD